MHPRRTVAASLLLAVLGGSAVAAAADEDLEVPAGPAAAAASPPPAAPAPASSAPAPQPTPAALAPAPSAAPDPQVAELRARLDALEKRVASEPAHVQARDEASRMPTTSFDASPYSRTWGRGLQLSGYVQAQYQESQLSQDQVDSSATTLNQNRFLVRRARLRFDRGWDFAFATVEIDGNNVSGVAFGLRRAEASLLWRAGDPDAPPLAVLTAGLTDIPFGRELFEPNRTRLFLERTTASRAFFPGDPDFGVRVAGAVDVFRYAVGVYDGTPIPDSEPNALGFDPTAEKDVLARFGVETQPAPEIGLSGGVSFVHGTGLHAGATATKNTLQWQDPNANSAVDPGEVTGLTAQAAQPSKTFERWLLGFDLQGRLTTPIGRGLVYGEIYVGQNQDRGLYVPDPTTTNVNVREIGWYAAFLQEVTRYGLVGLRVDAYDPNADATRQSGASLVPRDQTITTWSPLVGAVLPGRGRLMFEYDHILNLAGLDARGVPAALREDTWALRLQVEL